MDAIGQDPVGLRIRELRRQKNMSQAQLAHPELSDSYVSLIESGKRSPTQAVINLLASKLDCSPTYLVNGVTADQMSDVQMAVSYAQIALENGEVEEARRRFGDLLDNEHLTALADLRHEAEYGYALALEASGRLRDAIERFEALISAGDFRQDRRVALKLALCRCLREAGDLSRSIRVGEKALAEESAGGWNDAVVELGATLLAAYIHRGDRVRSGQLANTLLAIAESLGTPRARVAAYWNGATTFREAGDAERAISLAEKALAIQSETGDPRNLARLRTKYATHLLHLRTNETRKARELLAEAERRLAGTSASVADRADCAAELAQAEIMLGNPETALEILDDPARSNIPELSKLALVKRHSVLAQAFRVLGQPVEATASLATAADLLETMQASSRAAQAWFDLAEQLGELDDRERSKSAYRRALSCAGL